MLNLHMEIDTNIDTHTHTHKHLRAYLQVCVCAWCVLHNVRDDYIMAGLLWLIRVNHASLWSIAAFSAIPWEYQPALLGGQPIALAKLRWKVVHRASIRAGGWGFIFL